MPPTRILFIFATPEESNLFQSSLATEMPLWQMTCLQERELQTLGVLVELLSSHQAVVFSGHCDNVLTAQLLQFGRDSRFRCPAVLFSEAMPGWLREDNPAILRPEADLGRYALKLCAFLRWPEPPLACGRAEVFLSFHSTDEGFAGTVAAALRRRKVACFFAPDSIRIGARWKEVILQAINSARLFVPVCSEAAHTSPWVHFECGAAWALNRVVIALYAPLAHGPIPDIFPPEQALRCNGSNASIEAAEAIQRKLTT